MRCDTGEERRDFNRGKLRTHEIAGAAGSDYLGALLPRPSSTVRSPREPFLLRTRDARADSFWPMRMIAATPDSFFGDARITLDLESNVKDEPRPWLARRVRDYDLESGVSFRDS